MPKVVDHVERRKQIARALWAVVARGGFEAASARAVAAEGGWSLGALRHYFDSQEALVEFAAWELIDGAGARVEAVYASMPPGRTRCLRALEQLLPLDEVREGEVRSWVAILAKADAPPRLFELREAGLATERHLCRMVVAELSDCRRPLLGERLPPAREAEAVELHTMIGGLCLQMLASPTLLSRGGAVRVLTRHLSGIARKAVEGAPPSSAGGVRR